MSYDQNKRGIENTSLMFRGCRFFKILSLRQDPNTKRKTYGALFNYLNVIGYEMSYTSIVLPV